jgi:hypothetical protein
MSETIKAKTSQRLSSRRRVSCPLRRVSLSTLRGTIVPLLLVLLAVLADASYPSILPLKPLCVPSVEKKTKRCTPWNYGLSSSSPHSHLKDSWPSKRTPSRPGGLVAPQGAPLMRRLRTASSLMPTAPYAEFSCVSTTRSIRNRTHL